MVASDRPRRGLAVAVAATLSVALGGCDLLLGLDSYKNVQCAGLPGEVCDAGVVLHDSASGSDGESGCSP